MTGLKVIHSILGSGVVTETHGKYITVRFSEKSCRFVYPDAFGEHLKAEDPIRQAYILKELALLRTADEDRIRMEIAEKTAAEEREKSLRLSALTAELHSLIGLEQVKHDVQSLLNFIRICQLRSARDMKVPTVSYHLVFTGNPGTGKTTVARIIGELYHLMGILPKGQLIETDRSGLVAGYLGQTALKTQKVIQEALGGVLFIDEAYSLVNDPHDSYGKEAIETLLKAMEDHRNELVVIVAGYDAPMHQFIESNPGLRSRFNKYFCFPDYSPIELTRIFQKFCHDNSYVLDEDAENVLFSIMNTLHKNKNEHFGNARTVRNLFEEVIAHQANRLASLDDISDQDLTELTASDLALSAITQERTRNH